VDRCTGDDGFFYCEQCKEKCPQIKIDHIVACGDLDGGFLARLFCPSSGLQGLCKSCHDAKTRDERKVAQEKKKQAVPL
jgi:hypothetical protein